MAKAGASSPLEDLDLSGEEVQRLTSAFQDPEFRRMFSEYAEELTDPENRRRYEEEITALERERGVDVRFVHPQPGYVLRTSLDGVHRCFVNVCSNALVGAPSSRPGHGGTTTGNQWSLPYSLAPGREYAGGRGTRYTVYDVVFHPDALALARRHERFRQMLDITALEAIEKQFSVKLDHRNAKTPVDDSRGKAQFNKARRQLVVTLPVALPPAREKPTSEPEESVYTSGTDGAACASARDGEASPVGACDGISGLEPRLPGAPDLELASPAAAAEELVSEPEERGLDEQAVGTTGLEEEPPCVTGSSPGDGGGGSPNTSSGDLDRGSSAGRGSARGDLSVETHVIGEGASSDRAMRGPGTDSREPLCPPLQCNQDEESLTLLIQVPWIQPQSLQGDVSSFRYKLCFSTQDLVNYSFFLQFAPENKLSTKEPVVSISSNNAVIELAKSPECRGHWREWYYGLNNDSLEEKLFVNEENVNEVLEEVLSSPFKQTMSLTPPLIEVLQVSDTKIQIHAKLQECSSSEQLHEKEEVNEGSPLTEKENIEHPTTSTTDSDSSMGVTVLESDSCGSVVCLPQESLDVSHMLFAKSQQPESKMEPEFIKEKSPAYSNEEKAHLKEPVRTEEKELDGDHWSLLNETTVHNLPGLDNIKETNMQDGSVQFITDHVTQCAFSFHNSLLYDLD